MQLITRKHDLVDNIITFEGYLNGDDEAQKQFAKDLMLESKTIGVYKVDGENQFAPSSFLCYFGNTIDAHFTNEEENTRDSSKTMTKVLGKSFSHDMIKERYKTYAKTVGLDVDSSKCDFWRVKDDRGKNLEIKL
jgi:hypothetical protein